MLNGKDPDKRIGPSIILKVMAGDTIQAAVRAYYKPQATPRNNVGVRIAPPTAGITSNDLNSLKQKEPHNNKLDKPKAYLNYVFFDKQLKFVDDGSGVKQVDGDPGKLETLSSGKVVAKENGYVYVYTSNESKQDVLFDNFGVEQISGPVLEETHYYPFGLTMAGISTTAPLRLEGKRKFNGIEFNHKEFSDGSGLDLYTAKFRGLDPQIGRWWQIDPKPTYDISPYSAMSLNPILYNDFLGDTTIAYTNGSIINTTGDNDNFIRTANPLSTVTISSNDGFYDPLYTGVSIGSLKVNWINSGSNEAMVLPYNYSPPVSMPTYKLPEIEIPVEVLSFAAKAISLTASLILLPVNAGQPSSDRLPPRPFILPSYHIPPQSLPGFPGAIKLKPKTGRARWRLPDGSILEWDYQHGTVEKYNRRGRHQGEFDPNTGEQTKPRNPTRTTEN